MYDIHCHICFGCDDGAESLETAVQMIKLASEKGTTGIVATPHCNVPGSYRNYWDNTLFSKITALKNELAKQEIPVQIFAGQEIFCTINTPQLLQSGALITLNSSKYPLVEFDFYEYPESVYEKLKAIVALGYSPIVAHPERYAFVAEDEGAAIKLKTLGCYLQVNKGSLEGRFGPDALFTSRRLLDRRIADVVASDAHSPYMRTPNMARTHELISEEFSYGYADLLLKENPVRVLENKDIICY